MRVLVTRPEPASTRTGAEIQRLGHEPVLLPLMQAVQQPEVLGSPPLKEASALAVTSAEAMRVLTALPEDAKQKFLALPVFAVGRATARAARDAGFDNVAVADGDGRSLARLLIAECDTDTSILYLTGTPRSPDFEAALAEASRNIDVRESYRMIPTVYGDHELLQKLTPMPEAILVYSTETAKRIAKIHSRTQASLDWEQTRLLCLSEKIAKALPEEFLPRCRWPMEPREDLLLLLL
ncbi:uroporphyrinogen-III synthase [Rhizobium sp. CRIBSB]|nr:uroporphyrinogen-III synthase [Rhizobium sp. CRIBSB]